MCHKNTPGGSHRQSAVMRYSSIVAQIRFNWIKHCSTHAQRPGTLLCKRAAKSPGRLLRLAKLITITFRTSVCAPVGLATVLQSVKQYLTQAIRSPSTTATPASHSLSSPPTRSPSPPGDGASIFPASPTAGMTTVDTSTGWALCSRHLI